MDYYNNKKNIEHNKNYNEKKNIEDESEYKFNNLNYNKLNKKINSYTNFDRNNLLKLENNNTDYFSKYYNIKNEKANSISYINNEIYKNNESDINKNNSTNKNYKNIYFNNINIGINNNNFIIENNIDKEYPTYNGPYEPKGLNINTKINKCGFGNFFKNEKNINNNDMKKESINNRNKTFINKKNKSHSSKYIFKTEQNQNIYIKRNQFTNDKYNKIYNNIYRS